MYSKIISIGSNLPDTVLTNKDLEKKIDTCDEWIVQRTGIKQRHISGDSATMAIEACRDALGDIDPGSIDMVIVATCTADKVFPAVACLVQAELELGEIPCFDVQAACSGFIYALSVADQYIKTGSARRIMVVGSEAMSKVIDWEDRSTCVLFGDGAGAVILEQSDSPGIISTHLKADGRYKELLYIDDARVSDKPFVNMQGNNVFKLAVKALENIVIETLKANDLQDSDIDWLIPHQANIRIIQHTAKKLNLSMDKVIVTVDKHANTSAASIPLALDVAVKDGRVKPGQLILLESFGGGLTWGSALIRV